MHHSCYLIEDGHATGPHSLAVLKQKASIRVITADTPIRPADAPDTDWRPLRELPELHALLFAPRSSLTLGSARFESVNSSTDATNPGWDVTGLLRANAAHERQLIRSTPPPPPPPKPRNRRRRDYLLIAIPLNIGCVVVAPFIPFGFINPFLIGLFVMGNIGLAWVLYGVMDPY
jgi:hypothetical protein